jgi:hypothetical protein
MEDLNAHLEPGMLVRHPQKPEWGIGQVQSRINGRITVNFRDHGKVVIDGTLIMLELSLSTQRLKIQLIIVLSMVSFVSLLAK